MFRLLTSLLLKRCLNLCTARERFGAVQLPVDKMKVGDLVYWKDDTMKGYPDDNLFVVIDMEKQLGATPHHCKEDIFSYTHARVVSPSGWSRLVAIDGLEVISPGNC